jgi:hypothetical protein
MMMFGEEDEKFMPMTREAEENEKILHAIKVHFFDFLFFYYFLCFSNLLNFSFISMHFYELIVSQSISFFSKKGINQKFIHFTIFNFFVRFSIIYLILCACCSQTYRHRIWCISLQFEEKLHIFIPYN